MTAARGILHEEFQSRDFTKTGGMLEMIQLWVNLPKKDKMSAPTYRDIPAAEQSLKTAQQRFGTAQSRPHKECRTSRFTVCVRGTRSAV